MRFCCQTGRKKQFQCDELSHSEGYALFDLPFLRGWRWAQARQSAQRELRKADRAVAAAERGVGGAALTSTAEVETRLRELRAVADSGAQVLPPCKLQRLAQHCATVSWGEATDCALLHACGQAASPALTTPDWTA